MGIEPTSLAWEAGILPMNYTRINVFYSIIIIIFLQGFIGRDNDFSCRTSEFLL